MGNPPQSPPSISSSTSSGLSPSASSATPLHSPPLSLTSSSVSFAVSLPIGDLSLESLSKTDSLATLRKSHFFSIPESSNLPMPHHDTVMDTNEDHHDDRSLRRRPPLPPRQTSSYSKRHASFDTPREVPLPRLTIPLHRQPSSHGNNSQSDATRRISSECFSMNECSSGSTFSDNTPPELSDLAQEATSFDKPRCDQDSGYDSLELPPRLGSGPSPVLPNSRPFSTPDSTTLQQSLLYAPQPMRPNWPPDRSSTASLPLPTSTPYHTLPAIPPTTVEEGVEAGHGNGWNAESGPSSCRSPTPSFPRGMFSSRTEPGTGAPELPFVARSSSLPYDSLESSIPPPEPPTILTPPPPTEPRPGAPHEPFLSHGPTPDDVWIAIEIRSMEYRLVVRLPEFNRQSITIATRKRRVLHIVADRWEAGGGHFERRVSFGYDADLAQVRAEFDGEHLLVRVPRRLPPLYTTNPKPRLH